MEAWRSNLLQCYEKVLRSLQEATGIMREENREANNSAVQEFVGGEDADQFAIPRHTGIWLRLCQLKMILLSCTAAHRTLHALAKAVLRD